VESVLKNVGGVVSADADFRTGFALVEYEPAETTPDQFVQAINTQTFYQAQVTSDSAAAAVSAGAPGRGSAGSIATAVIRVEGMADEKTASQVTGALTLDGITGGDVNLDDSTLTVEFDSDKLTADEIVETLSENAPYGVSLVSVQEASGGSDNLFADIWPYLAAGAAIVALVATWPLLSRLFAAPGSGSRPRPQRRAEARRKKRKRR
jgi:copper chaperone CopZ